MPIDRRCHVGYLIGTSYCGSTMLSYVMNTLPDIASVGEVSLNRKLRKRSRIEMENYQCSCGNIIAECSFWVTFFEKLQQEGFDFRSDNWPNAYSYQNEYLNSILMTQHPNKIRTCLVNCADRFLTPHSRRLHQTNMANEAFIRILLEMKNAKVFFDISKSIRRFYHLYHCRALSVKAIWLVRDVRAFGASYKRMGRQFDEAIRHWKHFQIAASQLLGQIPDNKKMVLRYEDFCQNPYENIEKICAFLGIDYVEIPKVIDPSQECMIGNSNTRKGFPFKVELREKWRTELSNSEKQMALDIAGDINSELGYNE